MRDEYLNTSGSTNIPDCANRGVWVFRSERACLWTHRTPVPNARPPWPADGTPRSPLRLWQPGPWDYTDVCVVVLESAATPNGDT